MTRRPIRFALLGPFRAIRHAPGQFGLACVPAMDAGVRSSWRRDGPEGSARLIELSVWESRWGMLDPAIVCGRLQSGLLVPTGETFCIGVTRIQQVDGDQSGQV